LLVINIQSQNSGVMDRREFLTMPKGKKDFVPQSTTSTNTGLTPYTGAWTRNEVYHLLKRTMFGAKKADVDYFLTRTMSQSIDELINPTAPLPPPPVKEYDTVGALTMPDTNILPGQTWVNDPNTDGTIISRRRASFKKWWLGLMVNQDRSIREKMTLFLHNHLATETADIGNSQYIYKHHALLRSYAVGNFKNLVRDVTIDPGMLVYLNGFQSNVNAPDENYGRELQELFCCGKGPQSLYTENDVKAAAKVLTGWQVNATTITSAFNSARHDSTNKQFSAFYGNRIITGRTGATAGMVELNDLLDMIFSVDEVAKYICRRLYRWFVYYKIDANVEANVIEPLALIFKQNNFELQPVLSKLLKSEHFFDVLNQGCMIKSPIDHVVGSVREFGVTFPVATDYISNYGHWAWLAGIAANGQQNIGDPPDVSGWKSYYQEPQFYQIWLNSDTLPKRNQFTDLMIGNGYTFNGTNIKFDPLLFAKTLPNPEDPNLIIDDLLKLMFRFSLTAASKAQLKTDVLLSGQASDYYWTNAWNLYISTPTDMANTTNVRNKLKSLIQYLMNLSEYQLI
jgi:uncharacterized protein (DUF1800 family)